MWCYFRDDERFFREEERDQSILLKIIGDVVKKCKDSTNNVLDVIRMSIFTEDTDNEAKFYALRIEKYERELRFITSMSKKEHRNKVSGLEHNRRKLGECISNAAKFFAALIVKKFLSTFCNYDMLYQAHTCIREIESLAASTATMLAPYQLIPGSVEEFFPLVENSFKKRVPTSYLKSFTFLREFYTILSKEISSFVPPTQEEIDEYANHIRVMYSSYLFSKKERIRLLKKESEMVVGIFSSMEFQEGVEPLPALLLRAVVLEHTMLLTRRLIQE